MSKPKISPVELARLIALFDIDERVNNFQGDHGELIEEQGPGPIEFSERSLIPQHHFRRTYIRRDFVIPGELVNKRDLTSIITWSS